MTAMQKFRRKRDGAEVEAVQFDGSVASASAICQWAGNEGADEPWVEYYTRDADPERVTDMVVWTPEGDETCEAGFWIVKDGLCDLSTWTPALFAESFEQMHDQHPKARKP